MSKMKIEIRKPSYLATKEPATVNRSQETGENKTPFFFRLMLFATYGLSIMAIWYAYQKFSAHP